MAVHRGRERWPRQEADRPLACRIRILAPRAWNAGGRGAAVLPGAPAMGPEQRLAHERHMV
jgi:hypothetical protein